ncbi:MAG: hypothetical protein HOP12_03520 [Candidatus Eisenbacteria bacterium]|uniref:T9SS type A sorting domain-containing protein n=1 Tax=Eiseniibacteriota bacterium TaxID=2212470 RepID=A0A849SPA0_UNCEI|nr:hypothetical protein [Candidatus Eisenbacteria bacterium]
MTPIRLSHDGLSVLRVAQRALLGFSIVGSLIFTAAPGFAAGLPLERPDDPPLPAAKAPPGARSAANVSFGRFTHIQVNVNGLGANIPGDAANEPSIAVDPNDHNRMAIGWRQFDNVASNFRQAGFGFTTNGGLTWTAGKIEPGVFRSDPVLHSDGAGNFFYNSLTSTSIITTQLFPSTDGGATWGASTFAFGGDKQWMTIDRTGGLGHDHIYQAWSTAANSYEPNTFNRSNDDGDTFQSPSIIPDSPVWGTLDVASDGTLYVVGTEGPGGLIFVARSTDAKNALVTPTFTTVPVDLGGFVQTGGPNPAGLLGQLWVAVDRSTGPRAGWIYVLGSVRTENDPLDVNFIRSTDGGQTWSVPLRVNDDPSGNRAFQWFGSMSVSPEGRIDAVWNDTRASADSTKSALYYSYSTDGGSSWSVNEQASPIWTSTVGFPNQAKIGDYCHMVSDSDGADLAWAATFSGGQDVYYVRIPSLVPVAVAEPPGRGARLHAGSPNPFTSATSIRFDVPPAGSRVKLEVFDAGGHRVATLVDAFVPGGTHLARWAGVDRSGRTMNAGVYFARFEADGHRESRKLMLLR